MVSYADYYNLAASLNIDAKQCTNKETTEVNLDMKYMKAKKKKPKSKNIENKIKYSCEFCNEVFARKDRLERHRFTHTKKVK